MQNAIPQCSFYGIKVLNSMGSFSAVLGGQIEKLWQEFLCPQQLGSQVREGN
jgi:hypothetical protein